MINRLHAFALAVALGSSAAAAETFVIDVNGIVCEFCSLGVAKKVSRLDFVDRTRFHKGVDVDIENQRVTVAVKEDSMLDKAALFAAIRSGGYDPVTIWRVAPDGGLVAEQP